MERVKLATAAYVLLVRGERILMLRRYQTGYEDGCYSLPAGHIDGAETVSAAAIREANEECGVSILPGDLHPVVVMHRRSNEERIDFFFAATRWIGEPWNREPEKCDDLSWHDLDALPVNTIPYVRRAIEDYCAGIWYSEYGWVEGEAR